MPRNPSRTPHSPASQSRNTSFFRSLHKKIYKQQELFGVDTPAKEDPFRAEGRRPLSVAVVGGALGDEGKGRLTDELTRDFLKKHKRVVHYRDNGGANAGHTIEIGSIRLALHQLSSGATQKGCVVILGKEMVLHPEDLILEIEQVKQALHAKDLPSTMMIDENAFLCLDTHRAFEAVLKARSTGSLGSTGRGIAPAYADIVYRHPLQMRDLMARDWKKRVATHYELYRDWISGLGYTLAEMEVVRLDGSKLQLGSLEKMCQRLEKARRVLKPYVMNVFDFLQTEWQAKTPFVFEKAQALGLDRRWGVYPDVTASDCSFEGILSSTEGVVDPQHIAVKAATIKATYSSSVGSRRLPTLITSELAHRIREDANEYGSTTKRPRDIAYLDLPMLSYLFRVGRVEYLTITHLDIAYPEVPIRVCVGYEKDGKPVEYRPDQAFLDTVTPLYVDLPSWDGSSLRAIKRPQDLPLAAQQYLAFVSQALGAKLLLGTTGPQRDQTITWY